MPMTTSLAPSSATFSIMASSTGMVVSGPFERKSLLALVAGVQEFLEQLGVVQDHEDPHFLAGTPAWAGSARFHAA